ncbi:MAG TPA: DUF167 domain-containing protein [Candidatus Deferrimicrobiaceae bacterium]|nr:DUF167 domain-containing protein [Candidatus Deferrimicrobiaceae bacterium]
MAPAPVRIGVRLTPRAGANRVDGVAGGVLRARVSAAPADGAANEALLRLLAETLGIARGRVRLVRGATGRDKLVEGDGPDPAALRLRWPGLVV